MVVLNCELHVFLGARFCIRGRHVVFTTGHLQVPCAVVRLKRVVRFIMGDVFCLFLAVFFEGCACWDRNSVGEMK